MTFKEYLKDHCINATQLARKMGISRQKVSSWSRGATKPRPESMKRISVALNVPYNEIMEVFYGEHNA